MITRVICQILCILGIANSAFIASNRRGFHHSTNRLLQFQQPSSFGDTESDKSKTDLDDSSVTTESLPSNENGKYNDAFREPEKIIDIDETSQAMIRMDALEPYTVVTAVTASASFDAITEASKLPADTSLLGIETKSLIIFGITTSSILAMYSLVVFCLNLLYSKAAITRNNHLDEFEFYMNCFAKYRYRAYICFRYSLYIFVMDVILICLSVLPEDTQVPSATILFFSLFLILREWAALADTARPIYEKDVQRKG